jgi:hypothetical protein
LASELLLFIWRNFKYRNPLRNEIKKKLTWAVKKERIHEWRNVLFMMGCIFRDMGKTRNIQLVIFPHSFAYCTVGWVNFWMFTFSTKYRQRSHIKKEIFVSLDSVAESWLLGLSTTDYLYSCCGYRKAEFYVLNKYRYSINLPLWQNAPVKRFHKINSNKSINPFVAQVY